MTVTTTKKESRQVRRKAVARLAEEPISAYFRRQRYFDVVLAALLAIPGLPVMVILIALVRLTSPGPAIYRQRRVGIGGTHFTLLKIRSMRVDAEAGTGSVWSRPNDPRITWLGKILRAFHLDELPQLINVLRGEMSLVGPRPERPEIVSVLRGAVPNYARRLRVRPGITGLAQLNLPPDTDLHSVCRKVSLDEQYLQEASLWLDLRIVACTVLNVAKLPINLHHVFRLHRSAEASHEATNGDLSTVDFLYRPQPLPSLHEQIYSDEVTEPKQLRSCTNERDDGTVVKCEALRDTVDMNPDANTGDTKLTAGKKSEKGSPGKPR